MQWKCNGVRKLLLILLCCTVVVTKCGMSMQAATVKSGSIYIDGIFDDWKQVPHTTITYGSWNGTCNHSVGLSMDDTSLYVHIKMSDIYGVQLPMNYMLLTANGRKMAISMHFPTSNNTVDWSKDGYIYKMPMGITRNIGVFVDGSYQYLGEGAFARYHTNHSIGDELEYQISLNKLAKVIGTEASSIKKIDMQFPNIGAGTVSISGTPTGVMVGIAISVGIAGCSFALYRKKQRGEQCF